MLTIKEFRKVSSIEEAYELNQKKTNRIIGGMLWLKMQTGNVNIAIDLSGLNLDTIEETDTGNVIRRISVRDWGYACKAVFTWS